MHSSLGVSAMLMINTCVLADGDNVTVTTDSTCHKILFRDRSRLRTCWATCAAIWRRVMFLESNGLIM